MLKPDYVVDLFRVLLQLPVVLMALLARYSGGSRSTTRYIVAAASLLVCETLPPVEGPEGYVPPVVLLIQAAATVFLVIEQIGEKVGKELAAQEATKF